MKQDHIESSDSLDRWISSELGQRVLAIERPVLQSLARQLFGYYLLEISLFRRSVDFMQDSPIRGHVLLTPCAILGPPAVVRAWPDRLPIGTDSIDAVVLPHTLDFALDPHAVLREVERVLIPEGRVVICGFKPFSLWGAWRMLPGQGSQHPWKGHFISRSRLQDWLALLNFDVEQVSMLMYRPPWKRMFIQHEMQLLERLGHRFWSRFAGIYIIVAVKRRETLTPVRLNWCLPPRLLRPAAEPVGFSC